MKNVNITFRIDDEVKKEAEELYRFSDFLYVLNVGFDNDDILDINDMDFGAVVNAINIHYAW